MKGESVWNGGFNTWGTRPSLECHEPLSSGGCGAQYHFGTAPSGIWLAAAGTCPACIRPVHTGYGPRAVLTRKVDGLTHVVILSTSAAVVLDSVPQMQGGDIALWIIASLNIAVSWRVSFSKRVHPAPTSLDPPDTEFDGAAESGNSLFHRSRGVCPIFQYLDSRLFLPRHFAPLRFDCVFLFSQYIQITSACQLITYGAQSNICQIAPSPIKNVARRLAGAGVRAVARAEAEGLRPTGYPQGTGQVG